MSADITRTRFLGNSQISVGRFTYGDENMIIMQWGEGTSLKVGSFCSLAGNIKVFLGGNHRTDWVTTFPFGHIFQDELGGEYVLGHPSTNGDVTIGNDVWIGSGVTIMSGVSVGDGAVLAANACVVNDVPPYHIVGGNPAQQLKKRFDDETIALLLKLKWWDLPLETIKQISRMLCAKPDNALLLELLHISDGKTA
jgi:acetyltransferase-like isoleucine patch superfamily enzyme